MARPPAGPIGNSPRDVRDDAVGVPAEDVNAPAPPRWPPKRKKVTTNTFHAKVSGGAGAKRADRKAHFRRGGFVKGFASGGSVASKIEKRDKLPGEDKNDPFAKQNLKSGGAAVKKRQAGGDVPLPKPDPRYHIDDGPDLEPGIAKKWNEQMGRVRGIVRGDKQPWEKNTPPGPLPRKSGGGVKKKAEGGPVEVNMDPGFIARNANLAGPMRVDGGSGNSGAPAASGGGQSGSSDSLQLSGSGPGGERTLADVFGGKSGPPTAGDLQLEASANAGLGEEIGRKLDFSDELRRGAGLKKGGAIKKASGGRVGDYTGGPYTPGGKTVKGLSHFHPAHDFDPGTGMGSIGPKHDEAQTDEVGAERRMRDMRSGRDLRDNDWSPKEPGYPKREDRQFKKGGGVKK